MVNYCTDTDCPLKYGACETVSIAGSLVHGRYEGQQQVHRGAFSHPIQRDKTPAVLVQTSVGWVGEEAKKWEIGGFHKKSEKRQKIIVSYMLKHNDPVNWQQLERLDSNIFLSNVPLWWIL